MTIKLLICESEDYMYAINMLSFLSKYELDAVISEHEKINVLVKNMKEDNPYLITDIFRIKNYL